jgi:predicted MFS family arabinose efflux permease
MIARPLPDLAQDLGHLVTAFSLACALGTPVMAVLMAGLERLLLLARATGGFVAQRGLAALCPSSPTG